MIHQKLVIFHGAFKAEVGSNLAVFFTKLVAGGASAVSNEVLAFCNQIYFGSRGLRVGIYC